MILQSLPSTYRTTIVLHVEVTQFFQGCVASEEWIQDLTWLYPKEDTDEAVTEYDPDDMDSLVFRLEAVGIKVTAMVANPMTMPWRNLQLFEDESMDDILDQDGNRDKIKRLAFDQADWDHQPDDDQKLAVGSFMLLGEVYEEYSQDFYGEWDSAYAVTLQDVPLSFPDAAKDMT